MSVYETKEWTVDLPKYTSMLKDVSIPVASFADEIVGWFGIPKLERFDPAQFGHVRQPCGCGCGCVCLWLGPVDPGCVCVCGSGSGSG